MESTLASSTISGAVEGKKFGIRAAAYIIDLIIHTIAFFALTLVLGVMLGIVYAISGQEFPALSESNSCLDIIIGFIEITVYFTIFEWLYGATPGKLILGMCVVKVNGEPCDFQAALIRGLLRFLDGLFFGIPAYATMKPPLYQRIGDKDAKTVVVGSRDEIIKKPREWWWFLVAAALSVAFTAVIVMIQFFIQTS